jgi:hypothetical protein
MFEGGGSFNSARYLYPSTKEPERRATMFALLTSFDLQHPRR